MWLYMKSIWRSISPCFVLKLYMYPSNHVIDVIMWENPWVIHVKINASCLKTLKWKQMTSLASMSSFCEDLPLNLHNSTLIQKSRQCLCYLWKLRKFGISSAIQKSFYPHWEQCCCVAVLKSTKPCIWWCGQLNVLPGQHCPACSLSTLGRCRTR